MISCNYPSKTFLNLPDLMQTLNILERKDSDREQGRRQCAFSALPLVLGMSTALNTELCSTIQQAKRKQKTSKQPQAV